MLALATPVAVTLSVLTLFAVLVVIRFTLILIRHTRGLAAALARADERLRSSVGEIATDIADTNDRLEELRAGLETVRHPKRARLAGRNAPTSKVYDAGEEGPPRN